MKYYVQYVYNSTSKIKSFKTKAAAERWIKTFKKKYPDSWSGYWIDMFFRGTIYMKDEAIEE